MGIYNRCGNTLASAMSTMIRSSTAITDLDEDTLSHCASYMNLQDVSNMAMTCRALRLASYSDSIWSRFCREHWPPQLSLGPITSSGAREAYMARHVAVRQLKFNDAMGCCVFGHGKPCDHVFLDEDYIIYSQGSFVIVKGLPGLPAYRLDHKAKISCMRLFPLADTTLFRGKDQSSENFLVTSSCDHTIRVWRKGTSQKCLKDHNGPVSTLSDKLIGDGSNKVLASGGEDGTVRLWTLGSSGKRGQQPLKATLYGHEKPIKLMTVAGHNTSLLASVSKDSKVRIWDGNTASSSRSSSCVGMTSVSGTPVDMKCHESTLHIASSVQSIDLRTMHKISTTAVCTPRLHSFDLLPSASLICVGGYGKATLWDVRKNQDASKTVPVAEMDGHTGPVTRTHMDPYKIVSGGPKDMYVHVWEADTGAKANSLTCDEKGNVTEFQSSAFAVKGCRVVTTCYNREFVIVNLRDFSQSVSPVVRDDEENSSKFWNPQHECDTDSSNEL